jgi:hypothetical protein
MKSDLYSRTLSPKLIHENCRRLFSSLETVPHLSVTLCRFT